MRDPCKYRRVWLTRRPDRRARYCINWLDDFGRKRRLAYPTREMQLAAQRAKFDELNGWQRHAARRTWAEALLEHAGAHANLSRQHVGSLGRTLTRFTQALRPASAAAVTPADCDRYFAGRLSAAPPPSSATLHREKRELASFFAWATQRGYAQRNPLDAVKLPAAPKRLPRRSGAEHWPELLAALDGATPLVDDAQAWHLLILLAVATGVREGALLHTHIGTADDVTVAALRVRYRGTKGFCIAQLAAKGEQGVGLLFSYTGKTAKEEVFGLPAALNSRLAQRIRQASPAAGAALFPWATFQRKAWARIVQAFGRPLQFRRLRGLAGTQAATLAARQAAQQKLGHHSAETTVRHYLDSQALAAAIALGQHWPKLPPLPAYHVYPRAEIRQAAQVRNAPSGQSAQTPGRRRRAASGTTSAD